MTEDKIPDYSSYTLDELFQSYYNVDRGRYPDNYQAIINEFTKRNVDLPSEEEIAVENKEQSLRPKYFNLFRGLCIFLSSIGLFGITILLILLIFSSTFKERPEVMGYSTLKIILDAIRTVIFFIASVWLLNLKELGRKLIIICTVWSLIQSIYNTFLSFMSYMTADIVGNYPVNVFSFFIIIHIILDFFIIYYFLRKDVKAFLKEV